MHAEELEVRVDADGPGRAVVHLAGELDLSNVGELRNNLRRLYDSGTNSLVLDLGGLGFVDSTGLSELVAAHKHCRERGGEVVLRSPTSFTMRVLAITGLDRVLTIVSDTGASTG